MNLSEDTSNKAEEENKPAESIEETKSPEAAAEVKEEAPAAEVKEEAPAAEVKEVVLETEEEEENFKLTVVNGNLQIRTNKVNHPEFGAGDTVTIHYKIREGNKERVQQFKGVVLQRKGTVTTETVTIRKISGGIGVERIIPLQSPLIDKIEVNKRGKVRRARIFYLRKLKGKSARLKERRK